MIRWILLFSTTASAAVTQEDSLLFSRRVSLKGNDDDDNEDFFCRHTNGGDAINTDEGCPNLGECVLNGSPLAVNQVGNQCVQRGYLIPDIDRQEIDFFSATTGFLFAKGYIQDSLLREPMQALMVKEDEIWVSDFKTDAIVRYNATTKTRIDIVGDANDDGKTDALLRPLGMLLDGDFLYIGKEGRSIPDFRAVYVMNIATETQVANVELSTHPQALLALGNGEALVTSRGSFRQMSLEGADSAETTDPPLKSNSGLNRARQMTFRRNKGTVWIGNQDPPRGLHEVDLETGSIVKIVRSGVITNGGVDLENGNVLVVTADGVVVVPEEDVLQNIIVDRVPVEEATCVGRFAKFPSSTFISPFTVVLSSEE